MTKITVNSLSAAIRKKVTMTHNLLIPLQVLILGIIISYAIALMMKVILLCIRGVRTKKINNTNTDRSTEAKK